MARTRAQIEDRGGAATERPAPPQAVPEGSADAFTATPVEQPREATAPRGNGHAVDPARAMGGGSPVASSPPGPSNGAARAGCTAPQLRRFIKSRPYVPMHELRRRFGINGVDDDVSRLATHDGPVFVGLPARESELLAELVRGGEVGYELSLDPRTPIVVGVYPMRPVPRA